MTRGLRDSARRLVCAAALGLALAGGPASAADDADYVHVVAPGESLDAIANRLLEPPHDWRSLRKVNHLARPRLIVPGQVIHIPWAWMKQEVVNATVAAVAGPATTDGRQLTVDARIQEPALIQTGETGTVVLRLPDGSELRIPPASAVRIERLRRYFRSETLDARFALERGRAEARASGPAPKTGPARRLEIRTNKAIAAVRGTVFRVGDAGSVATTEVLEGGVAWSGRQRAATVAAGYGSSADRSGAVTPPEPLLPAPKPAGTDTPLTQVTGVVRFEPVPDAVAYRLTVSRDAQSRTVLAQRVDARPEISLASREDGEHFVRARAISARGVEGFDVVARVIVAARPVPPLPTAPAQGVVLLTPGAELAWAEPPDSTRFRVQVAAEPGFASPLADQFVSGTKFSYREPAQPAGARTPARRYWRVASVEGERSGPFGVVREFELRPGAPAAQASAESAGPVATWAATQGARYEVQLARSADFTSGLRTVERQTASMRLADLPPGTWYLRVRTHYRDGVSTPFGQTQRFRVPTPVVDGRGVAIGLGAGGVLERQFADSP